MTHRMIAVGLAAASLLLAGCAGDAVSPQAEGAALEAVAPAGGATGVSLGATLTVTFTHPMMQGMEMLAALHEGAVGGPEVPGQWNWSTERTRLTFTPAQPLKPATTYVLHLGGGMKDARGNPVDMEQHGPHHGGQWSTGGMMQGGMMNGGVGHMGPGWQHSNGTYGMVFSFTTAG